MPVTEPAGVDRPRHTERVVVYRLFAEHVITTRAVIVS
jgi:hypothetical protein